MPYNLTLDVDNFVHNIVICNDKLILTDDEEFEDTSENKKIKVMPVWKWLLEEPFGML